jgi:creatinine amidohydrolase
MAKAENRVLRLEKITHAEIKKLDKSRTIVCATMSPLEVHGPHLPLGQDLLEGYAMVEHAAKLLAKKRKDWTFLLLPPVPVAIDCVPLLGSISFPAHVVRDVAYHLLEPFAKEGFARLGYSSFHGGPRHITAMELAADKLTEKYGVPAASFFSMVLSQVVEGDVFYEGIKDVPGREIGVEDLKKDHHAGFVETSIGLHLWPELVAKGWEELPPDFPDRKEEGETNDSFLYGYEENSGLTDSLKRNAAQIESIFRSIKHFNQRTYYGYPGLASKEQGKALFEHLVGLCAGSVEQFLDEGRSMNVHSPLWKLRHVLMNPATNKIVESWLGM